MINNPLVTIIVITYNSSKYILETLESAKSQTYQNIELIISDDCSKDDTVELCRRWLVENKHQFVRTELIVHNENTGVSANCNRAVKVSRGEWLKLIAGDDILIADCILNCMQYISENNDCEILFGRRIIFHNIFKQENLHFERKRYVYWNKKLTAKQQHEMLLKLNFVPAPTSFMKRDTLCRLGGFNEKYPLIEDYPMWLLYTSNGVKMHLLDKYIVYYRIHGQSLSYEENPNLLHVLKLERENGVKNDLVKRNVTFWHRKKIILEYWLQNKIIASGNSRMSRISLFYYNIYSFSRNLYSYYFECKDRLYCFFLFKSINNNKNEEYHHFTNS